MGVFSERFQKPFAQENEHLDGWQAGQQDKQQEFFSRFSTSSMRMSTSEELSQNRAELYDLFSSRIWDHMDYDAKCQAIQALENDFAFQQGRPAKEVSAGPLKDGCYGGWNTRADKIFLNENLLKNDSLFNDPYAAPMPDANMQIFDTIAHEGYHAYQSFALEHPDVHSDKEQLREWALNEGKYFEEGNQYYIQPQERDAWNYGYRSTTAAFQGIEARNGLEPGKLEYENNAAMSSYQNALQREQARDSDILRHMEQEMTQGCVSMGIPYEFEQNAQTIETMPPRLLDAQHGESQGSMIGSGYLGSANSTPETKKVEDYLEPAQTAGAEIPAEDEYLGSVRFDENGQNQDAGFLESAEIL